MQDGSLSIQNSHRDEIGSRLLAPNGQLTFTNAWNEIRFPAEPKGWSDTFGVKYTTT